jgi:hypothetical protein
MSPSRTSGAESARLAAIGEAAAKVLRRTEYHAARTQDIAAAVDLAGEADGRSQSGGRSAVWLHNEVRSRRVLVALAAYSAWREHLDRRATLPDAAALPASTTLADATARVASALVEIVRFHRAERFLMAQVGYGIGDIATSEKRTSATAAGQRSWPDDAVGAVAADAFAARMTVFADFLVPHLRAAAEVVTTVKETEVSHSARTLSELVFRACLIDLDGPVGRISDGLAAYWFERDLVRWAGPWVRDLDGAERSLQATRRRGGDPLAEAFAGAVMIRVLLEAGTLHRRSEEESTKLVAVLERLTGEATSGRVRCDVTYRHGLALGAYGRLVAARRQMERSSVIAEEELGGDADRMVRAARGVAEVDIEIGDAASARRRLTETLEFHRARSADSSGPGRRSAWRRLTLTEAAIAFAAVRSGQVVDGVRMALAVLADRREHHHEVMPGGLAQAHLLCAEAWLAAGHVGAAQEAVSAAYGDPHVTTAASGHRSQQALLLRARIALAAGYPKQVLRLVRDAPLMSGWFADRVSPRLACEAGIVAASALTNMGSPDEAEPLFQEILDGAGSFTDGPADPLYMRVRLGLGHALIALGKMAEAAETLDAPPGAVTVDHPAAPERAAFLLLRARCASETGEPATASAMLRQVIEAQRLDRTHPLALTARTDAAALCERAGDLAAAAESLAPVLSTELLPHGRTALPAEHPLLRRAASLADRIGLAHPWIALPDPLDS